MEKSLTVRYRTEGVKMNFLKHLHTINRHKKLVMKYCFKVGLYRQGILHDISKYSPVEFWTGVTYFQGTKSPNSAEKQEKGYSLAWLHHKGRNKHHLEYWIDYGLGDDKHVKGMEMPVKYVVEMFCDRVAACHIYNKEKYTDSDGLNYYRRSKSYLPINKKSGELLESMLLMLSEEGEEKTFLYIRENILHNKKAVTK